MILEFISLAINQNCKLVTADKKILRSFPEVAIYRKDFVLKNFNVRNRRLSERSLS